jgi:hypothetical protein
MSLSNNRLNQPDPPRHGPCGAKGDAEKDVKSESTARWLGDAKEHKTHGRPISIQQAREKELIVESLEDDHELQERALSVFHAVMVTFQVAGCVKMVENQCGKGVYATMQLAAVALPAGGQAGQQLHTVDGAVHRR